MTDTLTFCMHDGHHPPGRGHHRAGALCLPCGVSAAQEHKLPKEVVERGPQVVAVMGEGAIQHRLRVVLIALLIGVAVGWSTTDARADACQTQAGCVETARSALDFTRSVGVNTHLGYSQTIYWQRYADLIRPRLLELGVSHIRDGTFPANYPEVIGPTIAQRYRDLGLGLNLLVGLEQAPSGPGGSGEGLQDRLDWIKSNGLAPQVVGIEGSNESGNDATVIRNHQCDTFSRVHGDPAFAGKPVVGPSGGYPFSGTVWYDRIGDLSACLDVGNLHPFPGEDPPHLHQGQDLGVAAGWASRTYGGRPDWITENGYWTKSPDGSHVSERAAGVYVPRMFMEAFRRGFERTQAYELIDLNSATSDVIHNYGLLRTDGTRKPAFTTVANTMRVLKDTASSSGSLGFGIVCKARCNAPIRRVLLKHSSGSFFLVVWSESRVWNGTTDTPQPTQNVNLTLHKSARMEVISPASSSVPSKTVTGTTLNTQVTDAVQLIRITP